MQRSDQKTIDKMIRNISPPIAVDHPEVISRLNTIPAILNRGLYALIINDKFDAASLESITTHCEAGASPESTESAPKSSLDIAIEKQNFALIKLFLEKCTNPLSINGIYKAISCLLKETNKNMRYLIFFDGHPDKTSEAITLKRTYTAYLLQSVINEAKTSDQLELVKTFLFTIKNSIRYFSEKRSKWFNVKDKDSECWTSLIADLTKKSDAMNGSMVPNNGIKLFSAAPPKDDKDVKKDVSSNPLQYGYRPLND